MIELYAKKTINSDYISDRKYRPYSSCIKNRNFINKWVNDNYQKLYSRFEKTKELMNSKQYSNMDILNDCILRIYTQHSIIFKNQEECDDYLNEYFKLL